MARRPTRTIRASFADAKRDIASAQEVADPAPREAREGIEAGLWDGAPFDKLPPNCPVVPLGVQNKLSFFIDALGQFLSFDGMKPADLISLFRSTPNFVYWAWPRKKMMPPGDDGIAKFVVNGIEEKKAIMCLQKAAAARGPFDPANKLRGRGAWRDDYGQLLWHSGDQLWMIVNGKLENSHPGEHSGQFYFRAATIMTPWPEPVPASESPAGEIFKLLKTWQWQRPALDPVIVLGSIGVMFLSGALKERPHVGVMGDFGTGKTALTNLIQSVIGDVLVKAENPTEAGVRQYMGLDALPVAIDEFEAGEDNSRVLKLIELSRIAYSGGRLLRGGSDHKGVEFTSRNAFFCGGINLPPMKPQDLSRFAILNTRKLKVTGRAEPKAEAEWGRQILRALMDAWPDFAAVLADWKALLAEAGLTGRGTDTYGTLFAMAQLMLGSDDMEAIGLDITEPARLGSMIAEATAEERSLQGENWRDCLDHLMGAPIEAIKGGARPTIGSVTEELEKPYSQASDFDMAAADEKIAMAGCKILQEPDAALPAGKVRWLLAVPPKGPLLAKLFQGTKWQQGVWFAALKQGPPEIVRAGERGKVCKINRAAERCLLIDLANYDKMTEGL